MGGEKILHSLSGFSASGSPPRGRGKEDWQGDLHNRQRITPAWAGKSAAVDAAAAAARDHPRVGGEKQTLKGTAPGRPGSPPRGRGKVCAGELGHRSSRITPAWAGKSAGFQSAPSGPRDHPRVGGEKRTAASGDAGDMGSPPRGRGKGPAVVYLFCKERITPAWAGKRVCRKRTSAEHEDHPRVGGEKMFSEIGLLASAGSPPRGRGKD